MGGALGLEMPGDLPGVGEKETLLIIFLSERGDFGAVDSTDFLWEPGDHTPPPFPSLEVPTDVRSGVLTARDVVAEESVFERRRGGDEAAVTVTVAE